jgi:TRAP-type C4-dicarboxylate transport system permease small subunit
MQSLKRTSLLSALLATVLSVFMMYVAWKHNAQGEIYTNETINFSYWFFIGFSWFLLGFMAMFLLLSIINYFVGKFR